MASKLLRNNAFPHSSLFTMLCLFCISRRVVNAVFLFVQHFAEAITQLAHPLVEPVMNTVI